MPVVVPSQVCYYNVFTCSSSLKNCHIKLKLKPILCSQKEVLLHVLVKLYCVFFLALSFYHIQMVL